MNRTDRMGRTAGTMILCAAFAVLTAVVAGSAFAADEAGAEQSNWAKFKEAAKEAGSAAWEGTKNVARKTGDFVGEKYDESKAYVQQKIDERRAVESAEALPEPLPEAAPENAIVPDVLPGGE